VDLKLKFINVGFGNLVSEERIVTVASPDSAPMKRLVQDAKESGRAVDASCGKKCRAVIICDSGHVVLSAITVDAIAARLSGEESDSSVAGG